MKTIKNLTADELRKSILQLAIQGKLVKQDPNDEPASELVKRIYEEKNKLIAEGKIKKDKNKSYIFKGDDNCYYEKIGNNDPVKLEDLPFDIPDNWMWIKVKEIFDIRNGFTPLRTEAKYWENADINWFTVEDIRNQGRLISTTVQKINHIACTKDRIVPANSLLLCCTASIGEYALTKINLTTNQQFNALTHKNYMTKLFNMNFILSIASTFKKRLTELAGKTTFAFVSTKKLGEIILPIPPLEEQQRIVDKINSFEPLLEKYDTVEKELSKLEKEFPEKLKKSILQYAIEGKLVKQDPNDEPASVLLERIKQEKEGLIKEGKIKRDKNESYIYQGDDKNYYENLPQSFLITNLSYAGNWRSGSTPARGNKDYYNGDIPWLKTGELNNSIVYDSSEKITQKALNKCSLPINKIGNVLIAMYGATIGKLGIVGRELTTNQACCGCEVFKGVYNKYLFYYLMSQRQCFIDSAEGGAQPNISREKIISYPFILMPYNYQLRLVCKLEALFKKYF